MCIIVPTYMNVFCTIRIDFYFFRFYFERKIQPAIVDYVAFYTLCMCA